MIKHMESNCEKENQYIGDQNHTGRETRANETAIW